MFGKRKPDPAPLPTTAVGATEAEALAIARRMSDVVFDGLVKPLKLERGLSSLMIAAVLGTLAGHACQLAALEGLAANNPDYRGKSLMSAGMTNGDQLLFGDALNRPVMESQYSVWAHVAGIADKVGAPRPDLEEVVRHVVGTGGSDSFGVLRDLPAGAPKAQSLLSLWMLGDALSKDVTHPDYVPVTFALAYQRLAQTDNVADPSVNQTAMARVMMESAIAMSKYKASPAQLGQTT